jgi:DNA-binding CsgD family transcriptional regulator
MKPTPAALPPRQRAVLELIIQGHSNKQIAKALGISEKTVKVHVCILFQKLGVGTRTSAAVAGMQLLQSQALARKDFGWTAPQARAGDPYWLSFLPSL